MDWELVALLLCILVLFACLIATFIFLLRYLGVFGRVEVTVGKPVVKNLWVAYKRHEGSYGECGPFFTEAVSLCPQLSSIAVYYDDPNLVSLIDLRKPSVYYCTNQGWGATAKKHRLQLRSYQAFIH